MTTISVCMIVKNEEKILSRCLDCLRDIADEIIIVDTGSTDNTKAIAKKYTDKIYDFEWIKDFSAARNYSLSFATKDYIYCADADEVIEPEEQKKFIALKQVLTPDIDIVQMLYTNQLQFNTVYNYDEELRPKLYRNGKNYRFEGCVHEAVVFDDSAKIIETDIRIKHMPLQNHGSRDLDIFLKSYTPENTRLDTRLHEQFARELYVCGTDEDFIRSAPIFERTLNDSERKEDELLEACCVLAHAARLKNNLNELFRYSIKGMALGACSELLCEFGDYFKETGNYEEAAIWYYNAAFEATSKINIAYCTQYPIQALANLYEELGMPEIANQYRTKLNN